MSFFLPSCEFNEWTQHYTTLFCFSLKYIFRNELPHVSDIKLYYSTLGVAAELLFSLRQLNVGFKKKVPPEKIQWPMILQPALPWNEQHSSPLETPQSATSASPASQPVSPSSGKIRLNRAASVTVDIFDQGTSWIPFLYLFWWNWSPNYFNGIRKVYPTCKTLDVSFLAFLWLSCRL